MARIPAEPPGVPEGLPGDRDRYRSAQLLRFLAATPRWLPSSALLGRLHEHAGEDLLHLLALALGAANLLRAVLGDLLDSVELVSAFHAGIIIGGHAACPP